jgi:hypothetical protein
MGICGAFWRENKINGGNYSFCGPHHGPLDVLCFFVSSGVPNRASGGWGWSGLSGWIKDLFQGNEETGTRLDRITLSR